MELVDIADLKSASLIKGVPVRVRPSAFPSGAGKEVGIREQEAGLDN